MADAKTTKTAESTGSADAYKIRDQRVKTLDSKDYDLGWTVQAANRPEPPEDLNPVTFSKDQLPVPAVMVEQGVPVESYLAQFSNVEGATVDEGVLVDEASGKPLSETLADDVEVENVENQTGTNPVVTGKRAAAKKV